MAPTRDIQKVFWAAIQNTSAASAAVTATTSRLAEKGNCMKNVRQQWLVLLVLFLAVCALAVEPPPFPAQFYPLQDDTDYSTGWLIEPPAACTGNLISVPVDSPDCSGNALILDTTNTTPAYLSYYVIDTNWNANLSYGDGTLLFLFAPAWASVSQGGAGPGSPAYLIYAGDSTNGS